MWTHFNDFPKFMHFVQEVTYLDRTHTHWVVDVVGHHEWDAVDENWIVNQQVGWRSTDGLENHGRVTFEQLAADGTRQDADRTRLDVYITYAPPAGLLGEAAEKLGAGKLFERDLQRDLINFARMVEEAPPGARPALVELPVPQRLGGQRAKRAGQRRRAVEARAAPRQVQEQKRP